MGLNVEQRKRLTIGVELAAKPALLVFLDEPTSGLDSQSSWSIMLLLRKLADHGQAILATIHQPSSELFQTFDRLLLLQKGGKTVYFGDLGKNSSTLIEYFHKRTDKRCAEDDNPAEYILDAIGAGASAKVEKDWYQMWNESEESKRIQDDIDRFHKEKGNEESAADKSPDSGRNFASSPITQLRLVTTRVFQHYNRDPTCMSLFTLPPFSRAPTDSSFSHQTSSPSSCSTSSLVSSSDSRSGCRPPILLVSKTDSSLSSWQSFSPLLSLNNFNPSSSVSVNSMKRVRSLQGCTTGRFSSSRRSLSRFPSTSSRMSLSLSSALFS